ncbi:MAG TPA: hypothetical protein VKQ27_06725, partial [Acetobacteraceae bacterium]|nr:hypothetical protein [Acetobacteraceae bacterium]
MIEAGTSRPAAVFGRPTPAPKPVFDAGAGGSGEGRPAWLERETTLERSVKIGVFVVVVAAVLYPFLSVLATSLA